MALLVNGELKHPIRIYSVKHKKNNFIIFESELPLPTNIANEIAVEIADFADKNSAKEIVSFEGLAVQNPISKSNVFVISNMEKGQNKLAKYSKVLQNGIVVGIAASLLTHAKVFKIPAYCLMAEAHTDFPDGLAAAALVEKLNEIYGFKIDTSALVKESKAFEEKLWSIVEKAKEIKSSGGVDTTKKAYIG
jgi:predicted ATP-grasp superfamily ATP-dependent carboligase